MLASGTLFGLAVAATDSFSAPAGAFGSCPASLSPAALDYGAARVAFFCSCRRSRAAFTRATSRSARPSSELRPSRSLLQTSTMRPSGASGGSSHSPRGPAGRQSAARVASSSLEAVPIALDDSLATPRREGYWSYYPSPASVALVAPSVRVCNESPFPAVLLSSVSCILSSRPKPRGLHRVHRNRTSAPESANPTGPSRPAPRSERLLGFSSVRRSS